MWECEIHLTSLVSVAVCFEHCSEYLCCIEDCKFIDQGSDCQLLIMDSTVFNLCVGES